MIRKIVLTAWCSIGIAGFADAANRLADIPRLKASVIVAADVVRIGDVIHNAGAASDIAIFRSPDVGTAGSVPTAQILEAVRRHNLLIVDTAGIADVEIVRDSRVISVRDIEKQIARAFAGQHGFGGADRLTVTLDREPRTFHLESRSAGDFQVARSSYDARTGRFDVSFSVPGSTIARAAHLRFTGTIGEIVDVPVLARSLNRGEVIGDSDIVFEQRPKGDVSVDTLTDQEKIVGLSARQSLRAGVPLRRSDLVRPEIVKRDEHVTIVYQVPGILLTLRGKAMESGALGDTINVINTQSKRVVQGVVAAPGKVTLAAAHSTTAINTASVAPRRRPGESE